MERRFEKLETSEEVVKMKGLEEYRGKDKLLGRPMHLNRKELDTKDHKEYAEIIFFGDLHYGHPGCDIERATKMRDYCLQKNIYVLGMGDYLEAGLRESVGDSVYEQELNPQKQLEFILEFFEPLAKKNLLLGLLAGNHEARILKATSVNVVKIMARMLNVPYLHYASWNLFYVGNESYSIYALHGASGSRFVHTKLKALVDISHNFDADIIAMGHVHELADASTLVQSIDKKRKTIIETKKFLLLTGHYLKYERSYAQEKGLPLGKLGSPKVKLFANKHDIHISY